MSEFQLLDVDVYDSESSCLATCYGFTADGKSVALHVKGFEPHVFWRVETLIDAYAIESSTRDTLLGLGVNAKVEVQYKRCLRYFECCADGQPKKHTMIRVSMASAADFYKVRQDFVYKRVSAVLGRKGCQLECHDDISYVHDSRVPLATMFMADAGLTPCQWVRATASADVEEPARTTRCEFETVAAIDDVESFDQDDSPLPVLCYDIEVATNHRIRLGIPLGGDASAQFHQIQPGSVWTDVKQHMIDKMQATIDEDHRLSVQLQVQPFADCSADTLLYGERVVTGVALHLCIDRCDDGYSVTLPGGKTCSAPALCGLKSNTDVQAFVHTMMMTKLQDFECVVDLDLVGKLSLCLKVQCTTVLRDRFPDATMDPVACIGAVVYHYNTGRSEEHLLTTALCDDIDGATVHHYATEAQMLSGFAELVRASNAFLLLGYNNCMFDSKYITDRLALVAHASQQEQFYLNLGQLAVYTDASGKCPRYKSMPKMKEHNLSSAAFGDNQFHYLHNMRNCIEGDFYMFVKQQFKMDNYSLKSVCASRLGDVNKDDVSYQQINCDWGRSSAKSAVIANYCLQDCRVLVLLDASIKMTASLLATARATSTLMRDLWFRGQEIRIDTLLYRECHRQNIVKVSPSEEDVTCCKSFQGATVLEPCRGFYRDTAVAVLDFASLYPSIMQAHNMCFSTVVKQNYVCKSLLVPNTEVNVVMGADSGMPSSQVTSTAGASRTLPKTVRAQSGDMVEFDDASALHLSAGLRLRTADGEWSSVHAVLPRSVITDTIDETVFVQSSPGIVPSVLKNVLQLRKDFRKEIKELISTQPDSIARQRQVDALDSRQLAAKVICNSVFGYTSANRYPMHAIASAITAKGRQMIEVTKAAAEQEHFPVIYGDTDSVFVQLKQDDSMFQRAEALAKGITAVFPPPNVLEFEKIYTNFLMINRKQYAGVKREKLADVGKLEVKGIASARRDVPSYCKDLQKQLFQIHMFNETGGLTHEECTRQLLNERITRLCRTEVPIDELQMSRAMKRESEYKNADQPQIHVTRLKNKRCPGSGAGPGERVAFVYIRLEKNGAKRFESAEDPDYVVANGLQSKIDVEYYLDRMETVASCFGEYLSDLRSRVFGQAHARMRAKRQRIRPLTDFGFGSTQE